MLSSTSRRVPLPCCRPYCRASPRNSRRMAQVVRLARPLTQAKLAMTDNATTFGIRPGEVAVELPAQFDASLYFIGRIRTPWTQREECPKNARESEALCTIDVDPRWAAGLRGIETCTHVVVL